MSYYLYTDFWKEDNMNIKWTDFEKQIVLNNYNSMTDNEICQLINQGGVKHSLDSVRKFRQRLNLKKAKGRPAKIKKDTIKGEESEQENKTLNPSS